MRILITGGAGALGSDLIKGLVKRGHLIRAFDLPTADFSRLSGLKNVEVFRGDITNKENVSDALRNQDAIFHLAAILPPASEKSREKTMNINVKGTHNLINELRKRRGTIPIICTSSVAVYGITARDSPPIKEHHAVVSIDNYSESKIKCEEAIKKSGLIYTILRLSAISAAELFELPSEIPYRIDQRVEFIDRRDAAAALISALEKNETRNQTYTIAGGKTWQMTGGKYIKKICEVFDIPFQDVKFKQDYAWFDWYETDRSQKILNYQKKSFDSYINDLKELVRRLLN